VSTGRHFASWIARAPFVAAVAGVAVAAAWWGAPKVARVARAPGMLASVAGAACVATWCADAFLLPHLYPAMHLALFATTLVAAAVVALAWKPSEGAPRPARAIAAAMLVALVLAFAWTPTASARLGPMSNTRVVLVEHAPLLGRAVLVAAALHPPPRFDDDDEGAPGARGAPHGAPVGEIPRALDWSRRDIVLLSVDALRADHVSAYGYARATTPRIDALAREGKLFTHAYCPTPHTSYSVTSMMTGRYMRPLLALGLGEDSDTWATYVRRYGWRTAAFYPPAVFFIDEQRFASFRDRMLDFEYAKVEFADPDLRARQVEAYLAGAPADRPLFLWVHFFEPHEPYVPHPAHPFASASASAGGASDVDAYDSEVAAADEGIGRIVDLVRAKRPGAVVILTADHGEEFGEHGGRYHGTTVYEEQVRVPLVVVGPGVAPGENDTVVQTVDLLPTVLSAIGTPRPARVRGRDLGPLLASAPGPVRDKFREPADRGFAFAETDDYALVASGLDRLVCERRLATCALYRPSDDPLERRDRCADDRARADELRRLLRATEREHGRLEAGGASAWPEALRRGMQGEAEAAEDVAALLDDAKVAVRRKAAEVAFDLHAASIVAQLRRALAHDEDDEVKRWCALALLRAEGTSGALAESLVKDPGRAWRRRAALAFAERGDARGEAELASWWAEDGAPQNAIEWRREEELLAALAKIRARSAVPSLLRALEDVRARPYVADTLGAIGDPSARAPLLDAFDHEPYVTTRPHEARALFALGARRELFAPLARFAGSPEPMLDAVTLARDAGLLIAKAGGWSSPAPVPDMRATLALPPASAHRLLVLCAAAGPLEATADGAPLSGADPVLPSGSGAVPVLPRGGEADPVLGAGAVHVLELGNRDGPELRLELRSPAGLLAAWIVARTSDP
jgi:arylsulfatase A-like enzyme